MTALLILAEEAAPILRAEKEIGGLVRFVLDNPFALALTFLFLVAMVGAFIAARKRDRCLKKFRGHHVAIEEQAGRRVWGLLKVFSKGLELEYDQPFDQPAKRSFLIYEAELGRMLALYRFVDRLDPKGLARRRRQAARLADPPLPSRLWRWARNVVNTFRDAIVSAMGISIQQAAKTTPNPALQAQSGQINAIGSMLIGETANAYEPMIEQYVGRPVILEVVNPADPNKRIVEYHGHLGEYSAQFVLLVNVRRRFRQEVSVGTSARFVEEAVVVRAGPKAVRIENHSALPVIVEGVHAGDVCHEVNTTVEPGATAEVALSEEASADGAAVAVAWERDFDMIVPRAVGIIRHASDV